MPTIITPPLLLDSSGMPANGTIFARATSPFVYDGDLYTTTGGYGRVVNGVILKEGNYGVFFLPPTPVGVAFDLFLILVEEFDGRGQKHTTRRTVSVPDTATATWVELVDVLPIGYAEHASYMTEAEVAAMIADAIGTATDVGYDIVLILGQSNAQGAAVDFTPGISPDTVPSRTFQYGATANVPRGGAGAITVASDPLIHRWTQSTTTMGPGMAFARAYEAAMPAVRKLLLVPAAYSGTGFARITHAPEVDLTWRVDNPAGSISLYESAIAQTIAAVAAAGANARIVAILWVQGESDEGQVPATYQGYLDAMIAGFRTRFALPTLPFIIGSMVPEGLVGNAGRTTIDAVHQATPGRVNFTAFATGTSGMYIDSGLHYNAAGQRSQGQKLYDALAVAIANAPSPPAALTGLAAGTPGTSFVPLSWSASAGATNYVVEYKATSSGTWLAGGTVAGLTATISGLAGSTSYDFRAYAINSGGSGAVSSTVTVSTIAAGFLLSDLTVPAARAYSTRKLHASYAGACLRVRNNATSVETDIGFASGVLDTAALLTAAGAQGWVTKWYDQSGNGRDLVQVTTTAQPRIVNASAVDVANTKPILVFGSASLMSDTAPGMYAAGSATACIVSKGSSPVAGGRVIAEGSSSSVSPNYCPIATGATTAANVSQRAQNDAAAVVVADSATTAAFTATLAQITTQDSGLAFKKRVNGVEADTVGYTRSGTLTLNTFSLGALLRSGGAVAFASVQLSESIVFYSDLSIGDRGAVEANQKAYFATP